MKRISILVMVFMVLFSCSAFAEKYDYLNENYDASHIKKIIVLCGVPNNCVQNVADPYIAEKMYKIMDERLNKKNISVVNYPDLVTAINHVNKIDINQMMNTDPKKANNILNFYTSQYDAYLVVNVEAYGTGSKKRPAYSYNTTTNKTATIYSPYGGTSIVNMPVTQTVTIPEGTISNATACIEFTLRDSKTNQVIFSRKEVRTRESDVWNTANPIGIAERLSDNYVNDVAKNIAKSK